MKLRTFAFAAPLAALATAAVAQSWTTYQSEQHGFEVLVPPGFEPDAELSVNGERGFALPSGAAELALSAGPSEVDITFLVYADQFQDFLVNAGWTMGREEAADWVTLSGTAGESVIRIRIEPRCGDRMMAFMLLYAAAVAAEIEPLIPELDAGLSEGDCSVTPEGD